MGREKDSQVTTTTRLGLENLGRQNLEGVVRRILMLEPNVQGALERLVTEEGPILVFLWKLVKQKERWGRLAEIDMVQ